MSKSDKEYIRKIQSVLQQIDNGVNVFFNVATYERLGLITVRKKYIERYGEKIVDSHSFHLTPKAKRYLNVVI